MGGPEAPRPNLYQEIIEIRYNHTLLGLELLLLPESLEDLSRVPYTSLIGFAVVNRCAAHNMSQYRQRVRVSRKSRMMISQRRFLKHKSTPVKNKGKQKRVDPVSDVNDDESYIPQTFLLKRAFCQWL